MTLKKITRTTEIHNILLETAKVFDSICRKHNIPYTMLGGTMLGTIRHNGFIPWDDDMDFGVQRVHYNKLVKILNKELPKEYRSLTYSNCEQIKYTFLKIENHNTVIDDPRLDCELKDKPGINIDVFPLDYCSPKSRRLKWVFFLIKLQTFLFVESTSNSIFIKILKHICKNIIPINKNYLLRKIDSILEKEKTGPFIGNITGRWKEREIFKSELYCSIKDYEFASIKLKGIQDYETYLSQLYGDYMQLPPQEQRIAHVENVFWR